MVCTLAGSRIILDPRSYGEIVAGDVLGSGTFGIVYKAELINSDDKVNCAFKRFKTEADFEPQELYNVIKPGHATRVVFAYQ